MSLLSGKIGLVVGVANKRSLSWAIAQAAADAGATIVLTYQGRFEEHVGELADTLNPRPLVLPLDVQQDAEIDAVFARIGQEHGRSEEHTSELQSLRHLVCRLLLEK